MTDNYTSKYYGAVLDENYLKGVVNRYSIENCYFVQLWSGFHCTETQFIFSFAVSKFQHLMILED
jgi:hypothetical protein